MKTIARKIGSGLDRRRFLGAATLTVAAAQLGMIAMAGARSSYTGSATVPTIAPGTNTSLWTRAWPGRVRRG